MTRPLSWLMLATHVPPNGSGGGMARYVVELCRAMAAQPDVELSVLTSPDTRAFFVDLLGDARRVLVAPPLPTVVRSLLERESLLPPLRKGFDVVHGTKHLLPRRTRSTRVLTVHDMVALDLPDDFNLLKRRLLRQPYLASIREADVLLCVSAATREQMRHYVPEAVPKARVVQLAMSSALLAASPEPVRQLEGRPFALVVGDNSPRKNLELVVDLWPEVVAQRPDAVLAIVGPESWGPSSVGRLHDELAQQGSLEPLGYVDNPTLRWCYENATVVLCPSRVEGFGLPAIEALAFGAPLITSQDAALCEVSGDAALHLPADDRTAWRDAVLSALAAGRGDDGERTRTRHWSDVAAETVAAVRA